MTILNERLSISDDVNIAYENIILQFNSKVKSSKRIEDWKTGLYCSRFLISEELNDEPIYIESIVYYPNNNEDVDFLKDNNLIFYKFDFEPTPLSFKGIKIATYFYNNKFDPEFYENLQHELNHAYQDSKGYIPKSASYDKVTDILNLHRNNNVLMSVIAFIEYCNHKFEQDSIINGYYRRLINEHSNNKISFKDSIKNTKYEKYIKCLEVYNTANDTDVNKILNRLKLSKKNFESRLDRMSIRFKEKMYKVYTLYSENF